MWTSRILLLKYFFVSCEDFLWVVIFLCLHDQMCTIYSLGQTVYLFQCWNKSFGKRESVFHDSWFKFKKQKSILGIISNLFSTCFFSEANRLRTHPVGYLATSFVCSYIKKCGKCALKTNPTIKRQKSEI